MTLAPTLIQPGATSKTTALARAHIARCRSDSGNALLRDGTHVLIRPIRPQDTGLELQFIERLSPQSRRFRFLDTIRSPSPALLKQLVDIDSTREVALIALIADATGESEIGVVRLSAAPDGLTGEFAIAVSDEWQHRGLGTALMNRLVASAIERGLASLYSIDAAANEPMHEFARHFGMQRTADPNDATQVIHRLDLTRMGSAQG
jgi:GNAT superfamily N-acetyltransferase